MNGPRRLRLVGAVPRIASNLPLLSSVRVPAGAIVIGETCEGAGALAFTLLLAEALHARALSPFVALCDFDSVPALASRQAERLTASSVQSQAVRIADREDLAGLIAEAERCSRETPRLFVGEPAVIGLEGTLKIVIDREGAPESLTPRARRLRAAGHLVLSSARAGVARLLAEGWHPPTPTP